MSPSLSSLVQFPTSPANKVVLLSIALHGEHVTDAQIAKDNGLSGSKVRRVLTAMVAAGLVERETRGRRRSLTITIADHSVEHQTPNNNNSNNNKDKDKSEADQQTDQQPGKLVAELTSIGMFSETAVKLAAEYEAASIRAWIEQAKVKARTNPPGYVYDALEKGWKLPAPPAPPTTEAPKKVAPVASPRKAPYKPSWRPVERPPVTPEEAVSRALTTADDVRAAVARKNAVDQEKAEKQKALDYVKSLAPAALQVLDNEILEANPDLRELSHEARKRVLPGARVDAVRLRLGGQA